MILNPYYKIPPDQWLLTSNADIAAAYTKAVGDSSKDERHIEEYVRQWILKELIESYKYPVAWLGERIVVEEIVQMGVAEKESDISIKNYRGKTYIC